jgi:hypothetical protein
MASIHSRARASALAQATHASRTVMANLAQIRIATESAMDTRIFVTAGRSFARVPRP